MVCAGGLHLGGLGTLVVVRLGDGGVDKGDRMQEALCVASIGALCREKGRKVILGERDGTCKSQEKCMSDENPYATVVGLCRGLEAVLFFLAFFGAGPVLSEDPAREDSVAARFRAGPLGPLARGGTSPTCPPESADVEGSG